MLSALERRGLEAGGIQNTQILHLADRETTNPKHNKRIKFTLKFDQLSPYAVMEILEFSEAQQQRYLKAYDLAKAILRN
jgi:hypothetical protein